MSDDVVKNAGERRENDGTTEFVPTNRCFNWVNWLHALSTVVINS